MKEELGAKERKADLKRSELMAQSPPRSVYIATVTLLAHKESQDAGNPWSIVVPSTLGHQPTLFSLLMKLLATLPSTDLGAADMSMLPDRQSGRREERTREKKGKKASSLQRKRTMFSGRKRLTPL